MTHAWKTEEGDISPETETSKYDDIEIIEIVDNPPPSQGSIYVEVIQSLIDSQDDEAVTGYKWRALGTGGRQKNTVQSGLTSAANRFGVKIETKTADVDGKPRVYVRLKDTGDVEAEGADEEQ